MKIEQIRNLELFKKEREKKIKQFFSIDLNRENSLYNYFKNENLKNIENENKTFLYSENLHSINFFYINDISEQQFLSLEKTKILFLKHVFSKTIDELKNAYLFLRLETDSSNHDDSKQLIVFLEEIFNFILNAKKQTYKKSLSITNSEISDKDFCELLDYFINKQI